MAAGQERVQRLHPFRQASRSLRIVEKGNTGIREKIAPRGQRKRQKKRGSSIIPAEIAAKSRTAALPVVGIVIFCSMEKTVHGLQDAITSACSDMHKYKIRISTPNFPYRKKTAIFFGISGNRFAPFFPRFLLISRRNLEKSQ